LSAGAEGAQESLVAASAVTVHYLDSALSFDNCLKLRGTDGYQKRAF
jgi:hypothetical protein